MLHLVYIACAMLTLRSVISTKDSCSSLWQGNHMNMTSGRYHLHPRVAEYDFSDCFILKARYNCAHNSTSHRPSNPALRYSFALHPPGGEACDLREMFNRSGGMQDLSKHIREWSHRRENVTHTNVLIIGSSFLRQVFESLVCRFGPLIRDGILSISGPDLSGAAEQLHPFYPNEAIGERAPMNTLLAGCHSEGFENYFEDNVPKPLSNNVHCSDYIGMAEFPGNLRIYYFFRHFRFSGDVTDLFARIGLNLTEVDVAVTNNKHTENERLLQVLKAPVIDFTKVLPYFQGRQIADSGKWYGADNIGLPRVPDTHPCMPGVPDDELDLLLLMLTHKLHAIVDK